MIKVIKNKNSEDKKFMGKLLKRNQLEIEEINNQVKDILYQVKTYKDEALKKYTKEFDDVWIEDFLVSKYEMEEAMNNINTQLKEDLINIKENIEIYHKKQLKKSYFIEKENIILGQIIKPIEKVGVYVPGGKAAYPSTVLMNVVPAKTAGVKEIIMITPPNKDGNIKDSILAA